MYSVRLVKRNLTSPHLLKLVKLLSFYRKSAFTLYNLHCVCQPYAEKILRHLFPVRVPYMWFCHLRHIFTISTSPWWAKLVHAVPRCSHLSIAGIVYMGVLTAYVYVYMPENQIVRIKCTLALQNAHTLGLIMLHLENNNNPRVTLTLNSLSEAHSNACDCWKQGPNDVKN